MESILSNLISYFSNIWIGIGVGFIVSLFLLGIASFVWKNKSLSILSFAIAVLLVPCIAYHASKLYGVYKLNDAIDTAVASANIVGSLIGGSSLFNSDLASDAMDVLGFFVPEVNDVRNAVNEISNGGKEIMEQVENYVMWYTVRRVLWSLLFIVIAFTGMYFTMENSSGSYSRGTRTHRSADRHTGRSPRRHRY